MRRELPVNLFGEKGGSKEERTIGKSLRRKKAAAEESQFVKRLKKTGCIAFRASNIAYQKTDIAVWIEAEPSDDLLQRTMVVSTQRAHSNNVPRRPLHKPT
jgi:hypothetical protein